MSELITGLLTAAISLLAVLPILARADREVEALRAENRRLQAALEGMEARADREIAKLRALADDAREGRP